MIIFDAICKLIKYVTLLCLLNIVFIQNIKAEDILSRIESIVENLTCETEGIGDFFTNQFAHTCIPSPLFSMAVSEIVSPFMYTNFLIRLKLDDEKLFSSHQCSRKNRADPKDPKITFGMCSNTKLQIYRAEIMEEAAQQIASSLFNNSSDVWGDVWSAIKNSLSIPQKDYYDIYNNTSLGQEGQMFDFILQTGTPLPMVFPWKIVQKSDQICVATISFAGWLPVGCKYIREPYPHSIYDDYLDVKNNYKPYSNSITNFIQCSNAQNCYMEAYKHSKSPIVIIGPLIHCIKQMASQFFVSKKVCSVSDISQFAENSDSYIFKLQQGMYRFVTFMLTMYVILFGIRMLLSPLKPSEYIYAILMIVFVTYFSIGLNVGEGRYDGMIQLVLPMLLSGMTTISEWFMHGSNNGLCTFSASEYPQNLSFLSFANTVECYVVYLLGLDPISTSSLSDAYRSGSTDMYDAFAFAVPPYFYLLAPAVITGQWTLASLIITYPIMIIALLGYLIYVMISCILFVIVLSVFSVVIIPLGLIRFMQGYVSNYFALLLSLLLQPAVASALAMLSFSLIANYGLFPECKWESRLETFGDRSVKLFYIDSKWSNYSSEKDAKRCETSLGYLIDYPMYNFYSSQDLSDLDNIDLITSRTGDEFLSLFSFSFTVENVTGMFFNFPSIVSFSRIESIIIAFVVGLFVIYLVHNFMSQLSNLITDLTGGILLNNIKIQAPTIFTRQMFNSIRKPKSEPSEEEEDDGNGKGQGGDKAYVRDVESKDRAVVSDPNSRSVDRAVIGDAQAGDRAHVDDAQAGDRAHVDDINRGQDVAHAEDSNQIDEDRVEDSMFRDRASLDDGSSDVSDDSKSDRQLNRNEGRDDENV
ncbi:MAG: hypothetical protein AB8B67_01345 [Rickettsiaceae bacterium]